MSNRFVIFVVILVVAIIVGVVWYIPFDKPSDVVEKEKEGAVAGEETFVPESISADHYFTDGEHTIQGLVTLPTPCHSLTHDVLVAESFPEQVTIAFTSEAGPAICTQLIDEKFFSLSFQASEGAQIKATFNGTPVRLILNESGDTSAIQKL